MKRQLSEAEETVLRGLMHGATLKSHRYLDGQKVYKLHPLDDAALEIDRRVVERLRKQGFIDSNKKFPAATYLLTETGKAVAKTLSGSAADPLSARNY